MILPSIMLSLCAVVIFIMILDICLDARYELYIKKIFSKDKMIDEDFDALLSLFDKIDYIDSYDYYTITYEINSNIVELTKNFKVNNEPIYLSFRQSIKYVKKFNKTYKHLKYIEYNKNKKKSLESLNGIIVPLKDERESKENLKGGLSHIEKDLSGMLSKIN